METRSDVANRLFGPKTQARAVAQKDLIISDYVFRRYVRSFDFQ